MTIFLLNSGRIPDEIVGISIELVRIPVDSGWISEELAIEISFQLKNLMNSGHFRTLKVEKKSRIPANSGWILKNDPNFS